MNMSYEEFKETFDEVIRRHWLLSNTIALTEAEEAELKLITPVAAWAVNYGNEHFTGRVSECGCECEYE